MRNKLMITCLDSYPEVNYLSVVDPEKSLHKDCVKINLSTAIHSSNDNEHLYSKDSFTEFHGITKFFDNTINAGKLKKDTGIMPAGFLGITNNYIVFERPPEYRNVFIIPALVSDIGKESEEHVYRIPIPWTLYFVRMTSVINEETGQTDYYPSDVRMHFMQTNLRDHDQEVFLAPIPNFYGNGNLCRPMFASMDDIERYSKDVAGCIQAAYDWIWNCGTNLDLTESCVQMFSQFQNSDTAKTVFKNNYTYIPGKLSRDQYYTNFSHIKVLFECWQGIDISEICDILWPTNSLDKSFHVDVNQLIRDNIEEYLGSIGVEPTYEQHWDEDTEEYYQCDDEDCDCRCLSNSYDIDHFLAWAGHWPPKKMTYKKSFEKFIETTSAPKVDLMSYLVDSVFDTTIDGLLLNS